VIIDAHTHIFPPDVARERDEYIRRDPTFAEMYANPKARIATAEELLASMDEAGIDTSVALGFAWREPALCIRHNDYLLEAASRSNGRIVAFCTVNPAADEAGAAKEIERCAAAGARGLGELRPGSQGWDAAGPLGDALAQAAVRDNLALLFHVSEPVGRVYAGKTGGDLADFYRFAERHPDVSVVGAHLAGGLPFYAPMPEVRRLFSHVWVDTAAARRLFEHTVYESLSRLIGPERILFGSDFPLVSQRREIEELSRAVGESDALQLILGGNAARLLGLVESGR
jgi:hypothetical protein